ncbi:MAG: hypothetical protein QGI09_05065 [Dehalococcoidia bacterium]|nr:hypothetical protein [Dehalococcoidia bacterium]
MGEADEVADVADVPSQEADIKAPDLEAAVAQDEALVVPDAAIAQDEALVVRLLA